jgi:hypothetical protein
MEQPHQTLLQAVAVAVLMVVETVHSLNGAEIHQQVMVEKELLLILMEHQESMDLAVAVALAGLMVETVELMLVEVDQVKESHKVEQQQEQPTLVAVVEDHLTQRVEPLQADLVMLYWW